MAATIWDWSSTAADNATADTGLTWSEGQAPSTVNDSARMMMKRVADFLKDLGGVAQAAGTANALTLVTYNSFTAYRDGLVVTLRAASTNTGETTLSVNSVGTKPVVKIGLTGEEVLEGGEIHSNGIYELVYSEDLNASAGAWLLINPSPVHVQGTKTDAAVDADNFLIYDSEDSNKEKKLTWANIKATLKTYFDAIYAPLTRTVTGAGLATGGGDLTANRTITVTEASQAQAQDGTASNVAMTPRRTTDAINAHIYSGTTASATDLPVGSIISVRGGDNSIWNANLNATVVPRLDVGDPTNYTQGGAGTALVGTWRKRGKASSGSDGAATLCQRVA